MNFQNGTSTAYLYMDDKKIFLDNVLFTIEDIKVNTETHSRFNFGQIFQAKVVRDILTIINTRTGSIKTLRRVQTYDETTEDEQWKCYKIYEGLCIYTNKDISKIKLGELLLKINYTSEEGISKLYHTDEGVLSISKDESRRPSTWNNIGIQAITIT